MPRAKAKHPAPHHGVQLRLYIAGHAPNSQRALANATAICERHLTARYDLEVIDVLDHPDLALADGVLVTPTLLKLSPSPRERVIGDLSDTQQVLLALVPR